MLVRRFIILLCVTLHMLQVKCADKYTDENRPYEFGFTIDGEQHRHEKKDENGIIMGEFGFITADGVYHVTVYATDENGNFKILSMKNIRVKPYPTAKSGSGPERGRSLEYSSSPIVPSKSSAQEQNKKQHKELPKSGPTSPAKSCSHCKLPTTTTTTTEAPYIPSNNIPPVPAISQELEIPSKNNQYKEEYSQKDVRAQEYLQQEEQLRQGQQLQQEGKQQQLQQGQQQQQGQQHQSLQSQGQQQGQGTQQNEPEQARLQQQGQQQVSLLQQRKQERHQDQLNNAQNYPTYAIGLLQRNSQMNTPNYPQQSYNQKELQSEYQKQQQQQQQDSNQFTGKQSISPFTIGSQQNYPQQSQSTNNNYPQPSYTQSGLENSPNYETGTNQSQTNVRGKGESNYPGSNILHTQSVASDNQGPMSRMPPETNRNPKSYDDQSNKGINALSSPASAFVPRQNSPPKKPQLISAQMQIVDKNTDIHYKSPGEKEGLPEGLTKDDMSQLLYTFNYTVGFHGHFEEGYKNGAKVGYYYVTGRNGVRTRVDYVADEKGFRPKITQEILDLLSDDVPKPDTEKDSKYGLKGYEFKWLYYPVDTK